MRREFWSDRRVALLPKSTRLFYIGLWCVADDAGYLRWDLPQIAGDLFPFESVRRRESEAAADGARLIEEARVTVLECARHAVIPTLPEHQKSGGEKVYAARDEHSTECAIGLQSTTGNDNRNVTVGNGRERKGVQGETETAVAPRGARASLVDRIGTFDQVVVGKPVVKS